MFELNLILEALKKTETEFSKKHLNKEELQNLEKNLSLSPLEYAIFQETKSLLQAQNLLSLESAMWIYNKLSHYKQCTIPEKYILTNLFTSMLKIKTKLIK
jgi:predicted Zn-dependent peptidase